SSSSRSRTAPSSRSAPSSRPHGRPNAWRGPGAIPGLVASAAELQHLDAPLRGPYRYLQVLGLHDVEHLARSVGDDIDAAGMAQALIDDAVAPRPAQRLAIGLRGGIIVGRMDIGQLL